MYVLLRRWVQNDPTLAPEIPTLSDPNETPELLKLEPDGAESEEEPAPRIQALDTEICEPEVLSPSSLFLSNVPLKVQSHVLLLPTLETPWRFSNFRKLKRTWPVCLKRPLIRYFCVPADLVNILQLNQKQPVGIQQVAYTGYCWEFCKQFNLLESCPVGCLGCKHQSLEGSQVVPCPQTPATTWEVQKKCRKQYTRILDALECQSSWDTQSAIAQIDISVFLTPIVLLRVFLIGKRDRVTRTNLLS